MTVLDNALAHFERNRDALLSIDVAQWGTQGHPAKIHFYGVATMIEKGLIREAMKLNEVRGMMVLLCYRALDANKEHLFPIGRLDEFMEKLDPDVVATVAAKIENVSAKYREEMETAGQD
jgi:hypothetical protein